MFPWSSLRQPFKSIQIWDIFIRKYYTTFFEWPISIVKGGKNIDYGNQKCVVGLWSMMTSSYGNIFRVIGPLCGEFTHKGQWRGALMFTLICVWINGCVNNREAADLRRYCVHYGVTVMSIKALNQHIYLLEFNPACHALFSVLHFLSN